MLDENIENLSPDEQSKDIDNNIEQSEEKKPPVDNILEEKKSLKNDVIDEESPLTDDNAENTDDLDKLSSEKPEAVEEMAVNSEKPEVVEEMAVSSEKPEEIEKDDVEIKVKEQGSEKLEKVEDLDEHSEKPVVINEVESISESEDAKLEEKDKDDVKTKSPDELVSQEDKAVKEPPSIDYTKLNLEEIVVIMQELIDNFPFHKIKVQFEALQSGFNKKYKIFITDKKKEFIKEGGNEIDFKFYLSAKNTFNNVLHDFKRKRQKHYKEVEAEQKQNLERKLQLINDLKELIDTAEPSTMYKNFRSLQDEWRTIGQIPHTKYNDVWRTYHHHVERFYDLLHLNNDFRDLDFKHNLEEKTKLIEKVEKLGDDPDVNSAFKELQIIHRMWKEDIGPVGRDVREEVWNRFSEATKKIHNRRHEFQNELESKFKENVTLKLAVVDKIKSIKTEGYTSHKLWQNAIREMEELRKEFFAIGRVPRSKNEEVWQIFKDATKNFNKAKNTFYKSVKKEQLDNLTKKMQLIEQAETLKDSEDWEMVTEVFKKIQADWKNTGHVPRRDSDRIWKRFKDACNHYFDQLHSMQDGHNKGQAEIFNKKKELLDKFKADIDHEDKLDLDLINKYISEWRDLGVVPANMRHIEAKLNKAIDNACKKLNISKEETELLKFKNVIDAFLEQKDVRKLDNEQLFIKRKVDDLTKEIKQLENNISFISNASDDNPLVRNVYKNIETYTKDLKIWQRKLAYIRQLEY